MNYLHWLALSPLLIPVGYIAVVTAQYPGYFLPRLGVAIATLLGVLSVAWTLSNLLR